MRQIILALAAVITLSGCQKSAKTPTYDFTCTVYAISTATGDTSVHYSATYVGSQLTAAQTQDSINLSVNNGFHPFSFTICN